MSIDDRDDDSLDPGEDPFDDIRPEDLPPPATFAGRAGQPLEGSPADDEDEIPDGSDVEPPPSIEEVAPRGGTEPPEPEPTEPEAAPVGEEPEPPAAKEPEPPAEEPEPPAEEEAAEGAEVPIEHQETIEADIIAFIEAEGALPPDAEQPPPVAAPKPEVPAPAPEEPEDDLAPPAVVKPAPYVVSSAGAVIPADALGEDPAGDTHPPKLRLWPRFLAASMMIVISFATATAVTVLVYLTEIAEGLGGLPEVRDQLVEAYEGGPQNFLILGSDIRPGDESARSDTTMILRVEPDPAAVRIFSLPRDLEVNIPNGFGKDKLNAAYSLGGPELTLETVQNLTGLEFQHVINVDFAGFARAVDAIECVLIDVDQRYLNEEGGDYAVIDLQPGYQQLCGLKALQFVRYRHTDNDIYRGARQQMFIREARAKLSFDRLFNDRDLLLDIFTDSTESDIEKPFQLLELLKLFLEVKDAPVQQIPFEGELGPIYVTAGTEEIKSAIDALVTGTDEEPITDTSEDPAGEDKGGVKKGGKEEEDEEPEPEPVDADSTEMVDTTPVLEDLFVPQIESGLQEVVRNVNNIDIFLPTQIVPFIDARYSDSTRGYEIDTYNGDRYPAYKAPIIFDASSGVEEYYGVQGVRWSNPPILENPSESREIDGRKYDFYYDGDRLRLIAWQEGDWSYWISNTLLNTLSEEQMIATVESLKEY